MLKPPADAQPARSESVPSALVQAELEVLLGSGILGGPSSNAARLLRFVCEWRLQSPKKPVTEFDIAVGALGRRSDFDSRADSVVRVEAHRVRKRLQEYYERDGASHRLHISLPRGQYEPTFVMHADTQAGPPASEQGTAKRGLILPRWRAEPPVAMLMVSALVVALAGGIWLLMSTRTQPVEPESARRITPATGPALSEKDSVRILAGSSTAGYVDRAGYVWGPDRYFKGGEAVAIRYPELSRSEDLRIYQNCRTGYDFMYDIPLKPGVYELRLHFAESSENVPILGEAGESARPFVVTANGRPLLPPNDGRHMPHFDITADADGINVADVKVFKDVSPGPDGQLHLRFLALRMQALVNGIEIVPGLPGRMHSMRWRASQTPYTGHRGEIWLPDRYYKGGRLSGFHAVVTATPDPGLFEGERFGHFSYSIPVAQGTYSVTLSFAENFHTIWDTRRGIGTRLFNIYANGTPLLRNFDVFRAADGAQRAVTKTFRDLQPTPQEKLVLTFEPVSDYAIVNAIEVVDQGK